jgi:aspartokinase
MKASVNQTIWRLLQSDLAIQKDLSRKIINMRALAKYIIKKYGLRASLDSVISAIRRFQSQENFEEKDQELMTVFSEAMISTKNSISVIKLNLRPSDFFLQYKDELSKFAKDGMKTITGTKRVRVAIEQKSMDKLKKVFKKEEIDSIDEGLSEISIIVNDDAAHTKGVIARISTELALSNINIHELIVNMPEFLVYVKQKDIVKAHSSLLKLVNANI